MHNPGDKKTDELVSDIALLKTQLQRYKTTSESNNTDEMNILAQKIYLSLKSSKPLDKNNLDTELADLLINFHSKEYEKAISNYNEHTDPNSEQYRMSKRPSDTIKNAFRDIVNQQLDNLIAIYKAVIDVNPDPKLKAKFESILNEAAKNHYAATLKTPRPAQVLDLYSSSIHGNNADFGLGQSSTNDASDKNQSYALEILRILIDSDKKDVATRGSNKNMQMLTAIANELKNGINNVAPIQQLQNIINSAKLIFDNDDLYDRLDYNQQDLCGILQGMATNSLTQNQVNMIKAIYAQFITINKPQTATDENSTTVLRMSQITEPITKAAEITDLEVRYANKILDCLQKTKSKLKVWNDAVNSSLLTTICDELEDTKTDPYQKLQIIINSAKKISENDESFSSQGSAHQSLRDLRDEFVKMQPLKGEHVIWIREFCDNQIPTPNQPLQHK